METWDGTALVSILFGGLISAVILYVIVRYGVQHGTTTAMRRHELWMRDGSFQTALDEHAARYVAASEQQAAARAQLRAERGVPSHLDQDGV